MTRKRRQRAVDPDFDPHSVVKAEKGEVACRCGWMSGTHRWIGSAWDAYYVHYALYTRPQSTLIT